MPDTNSVSAAQENAPAPDPARLAHYRRRLESEQNMPAAVVAGGAAAAAGAAAWAGITVATGFQIGFMAVGIGFLVGYSVRAVGRGVTSSFGILGAILAVLGCAIGNVLAATAIAAQQQGIPFLTAVTFLNPPLVKELMVAFFGPIDVLFYAIAVYEGYRLSFRQVTPEDLGEHG